MSIVCGVIYKVKTDGKVRFVTQSGRVYMWAYGAWRFQHQFNESTYRMFRRAARLKDSKVFVASSRKVFMENRVALDPLDHQYMELSGTNQRMSKSRLLRRNQVSKVQQNAAIAYATEASNHLLTGYQPNIAPTPFYMHKQRPPKSRK